MNTPRLRSAVGIVCALAATSLSWASLPPDQAEIKISEVANSAAIVLGRAVAVKRTTDDVLPIEARVEVDAAAKGTTPKTVVLQFTRTAGETLREGDAGVWLLYSYFTNDIVGVPNDHYLARFLPVERFNEIQAHLQRISSARCVARGSVDSVQEAAVPDWDVALIAVERTLAGDCGSEDISLWMPRRAAGAYPNAPRFSAGQEGFWVVRDVEINGRRVQATLDPMDFQPSAR